MPLEVARLPVERVLAAARRGRNRFGGREVLVGIERAQLEAPAIDLLHAIDRIQDVVAHGDRRLPGVGFEACHECVEPFLRRDEQRRRSEIARLVVHADGQLIGAVSHVLNIKLEGKRRVAEVAAEAVEDAKILHDLRRRRRSRAARGCRRRPCPQFHVRFQRTFELNRRAVDLFEPDDVRLRGIGHDPIRADHQRVGVVGRICPLTAREQRLAFGEEPPHFGGLAEARRFGDFAIERVDLPP